MRIRTLSRLCRPSCHGLLLGAFTVLALLVMLPAPPPPGPSAAAAGPAWTPAPRAPAVPAVLRRAMPQVEATSPGGPRTYVL